MTEHPAGTGRPETAARVVPHPLFRDPVFDGAADPTVIRHRATGEWWLFYTQRRPTDPGDDVAWVHGSRIGVARSADGRGYRMYLSVVDGVPDRWEGHERHIVEYRSDDLEHWERLGVVPLGSELVIDACVAHCPDGLWRLWYKNEADGSSTWAASARDLADGPGGWTVEGRVIGGRPHEGPNVFELGGWWWMIVDEWRGMGVYRSPDAVDWRRQGGEDDVILGSLAGEDGRAVTGRHGDVVVEDGAATLYYFTHPHWDGDEIDRAPDRASRTTWLYATPLEVTDGTLTAPSAPSLR